MKVENNAITNTYTVTITDDELRKAFSSCSNLQTFLHDVAKNTIGESFADRYFPAWED